MQLSSVPLPFIFLILKDVPANRNGFCSMSRIMDERLLYGTVPVSFFDEFLLYWIHFRVLWAEGAAGKAGRQVEHLCCDYGQIRSHQSPDEVRIFTFLSVSLSSVVHPACLPRIQIFCTSRIRIRFLVFKACFWALVNMIYRIKI